MSRRMDREGVRRSIMNYDRNMRFNADPRCKEDERGWVQPFTVWQGWEEWNRAMWAIRSALICRNLPRRTGPVLVGGTVDRDALHRSGNRIRREDDLHTARFSLERSRKCDRPALP